MAKDNDNQTTTSAKAKKAGFDAEGNPYPGVHPETGERMAVTLDGLKKEFGPKTGEVKFRQIGQATGVLDALAPLESQAAVAGGISLVGAPQDTQFKVSEILASKE